MDGEFPTVSIEQITPMSGVLEGGIGVTIYGSGFQKDSLVYFGGQLAEKIVVESDSIIETVAPPAIEPGTVNVTVVNPDNSQAIQKVGFVYISQENPDRAVIFGVYPETVIEGAETEIVFHGQNLVKAYEDGLVALRCPGRLNLEISKVTTGGPDESGIETITYKLTVTGTPALEPLERIAVQALASRRPESKDDLIVESSKQMFIVLPRDVPVPIAQTPSLSTDKPTMVVVLGRNLDGCTLEFAEGIKTHIQKSGEDSLYGLITIGKKYSEETQTTFSILDKQGNYVGNYNLSIASSSELRQLDPLPSYSEPGPSVGYMTDLIEIPDQQFLGPTANDARIFDLKGELQNNLSLNTSNVGTIAFSYRFRFVIFNRVYLFALFDDGGDVLGRDVLAEVGKLFSLRGSGILYAARIEITITIIIIIIITIDFPWLYGGFNEFPEEFPNAIGSIIIGWDIDIEIIVFISFLNALVLPDGRLRLLFAINLIFGVHFSISPDGLRFNFIPNNTHFVRYYSILPFSEQFPCSGRFQLADDNGQTVFTDQFGGRRSFYFPRLSGDCCPQWSFNLELARFIGTSTTPETVQPTFSSAYCLNAAPSSNGYRRPYVWSDPEPSGTPPTLEMQLGTSAELVVLAEPVDEDGNPTGPPVDIKTLDHDVRFYLANSLQILEEDELPDGHAHSIEEGDNIVKAAVTSVRVLDDETEVPPLFSFYPGSIVAFNILRFLALGESPRVEPQGLPVSVDFTLPAGDYVIEPKLAYETTGPTGPELVEIDRIERLEPHETPRKYVLAAKVTAPSRASDVTISFTSVTFEMKSGALGNPPLKLSKTGFQFGEGRETETDPKNFFSGNLVNQGVLKLKVTQTQDLRKLIAFDNGDLFPNLVESLVTTPSGTVVKCVPPGKKVTGSETKLRIQLPDSPTITDPPGSTATVSVSLTDFDFRVQNEEVYEEYFRVFHQIHPVLHRTPPPTSPPSLVKLVNFAADFATELKTNGTTNLIAQGQELWQAACEYVQIEKDDRLLYYARLEALAVLRAYYKRTNGVDVPIDLVNKFEWSSRGLDIVPGDRPIIMFDPTTARKVIITGFDPFQLYDDPSISNTSGIAALMLNKESFTDAIVRSVVLPVRFRDFNASLIEQIMTEAVKTSSMIMTCSWTPDYYFHIDRFATRHRTDTSIDNEYELGGSTNPHGAGAPNYLETTLPYESREVFFNSLGLHQELIGGDSLVLDQSFAQSPGAGAPDPVPGQVNSYQKSTTVPASTGEVQSGSGGSYLSNEIFYRTAKVRKENQPGLLTGHFHIRRLEFSTTDFPTLPSGVPRTMSGEDIYKSVKDALGRFLSALKRFTFPDTKIAAPITRNIPLTNTGSTTQNIATATFVSGTTIFEVTTTLPTTIAAGATKNFEIKFKPADVKNYMEAVQFRDSADKVLHCVQLEGKGIDPISSTPPSVNFPDTVINMENTITAQIKNLTATQTVIVKSAVIDPPFSLLTTLPVTIAPGAEVAFNVKFNPTTIDNFTDDLELKDDSNNLLLKIPLSGKGIAQPPIPVVATFTPRSGYPGQSIMVTGENFINVDEVRIGDDIVYHETPVNSTQIEIIAGNVGGKIKIKTASGEGTSTFVFLVRPIRIPPED